MRVVITGITGLLGQALQDTSQAEDRLWGIYYPERPLPLPLKTEAYAADIRDLQQMKSIFQMVHPHVVIHTAGVGSVDFAERNKDYTRDVNIGGTEVIISLCRIFEARLIYISSNAVFNGRQPFYSEDDPVSPINYYGCLKVEAERIVKSSGLSAAIVRPILMYGWPYPGERENPVVWWIKSLRDKKPIKVVDNVFSKPLFSHSCAEVIWAIIREGVSGIFHAAGLDHVSLYNFSLITADIFGLDPNLITPVPDSYFPEIAPRPQDTSFDTSKIENELNIRPLSLRDGLLRMIKIGERV